VLLYSYASAEGKANSINLTDLIVNPKAEIKGTANTEEYDNCFALTGWILAEGDGGATVTTVSNDSANEPPTNPKTGETYSYFEGGNLDSDNWSICFYQQTSEMLPAGKYRVAVMARSTADPGDEDRFTLWVNGQGHVAESTYDVTSVLAHEGSEGGDYGNGWYEHIIDFTVTETAYVQFQIDARGKEAGRRVNFTNFRLRGWDISDEDLLKRAQSLLDNEDYANVKTEDSSEHIALQTAVTDQSTVNLPTIITDFTDAKDGYDAYAEAKAKVDNLIVTRGFSGYSDDSWDGIEESYSEAPTTASDAAEKATTINNNYLPIVESAAVAGGVAKATPFTDGYLTNTKGASSDEWFYDTEKAVNTLDSHDTDSQCPTMSDGTQIGYYNISWEQAVDVTFSQTSLKELPIGCYRLALMTRGSSNRNLTKYRLVVRRATATDNAGSEVRRRADALPSESDTETDTETDSDVLVEKDLMAVGTTGGDYGNGWNENYVDFTVDENEGTAVTVSVEVATGLNEEASNVSWVSFTNARLTQTAPTPTGIEDVTVDSNLNVVIDLDNATIYDLYGRRVKNPAPGIYMVNGLKVVIK
jgi:hypothetical protein